MKKRQQIKNIKRRFLKKPPLMLNQKGYDCKHYALSAVLQWLFDSKLIDKKPAPARQREEVKYKEPTLHRLLKQQFNSTVGEVHNVVDLAAVAETQDQVAAYFCECKLEAEYYVTLKRLIDQGIPAIVFFDVDISTGLPLIANGKTEHAVPVIGYSYDRNNHLYFRVTQWERYFDLDAKELFHSTSQLPRERLSADNYFKIKSHDGEGAWLPEDLILTINYLNKVTKREPETSPTKNGGLCQKILILDSTKKSRFIPSEMPVRFNRPTPISGEKNCLPTKDRSADEKWDRQIEENLARFSLEEEISTVNKMRTYMDSVQKKSDVIKKYIKAEQLLKTNLTFVPMLPILKKIAQFRLLTIERDIINGNNKDNEDKISEQQVKDFLKSTQSKWFCFHSSAYQIYGMFCDKTPHAEDEYQAKKNRLTRTLDKTSMDVIHEMY